MAALLYPVNSSVETISMRSRHVSGWEARQVVKTCLERPGDWPGLVLWAGCFEGCWLLLVVLCPLACVLVG